MASKLIVPVPTPASSNDMAQFLAMDGVGAGYVRHADIWWNTDAFLEMVWAHIKSPRKNGTMMKLVYVRHTVIETELAVECCAKRLGCMARCGVFPDDEIRATAMTFGQARKSLTANTALCENMVVLVDGTCLETVDTEISKALLNQSINPVSCVKIIGLYSDDWDDQAAKDAVPLFSPLFREVGIQKLSVAFGPSSIAGADLVPTLVDQRGLVDAMVECINDGKHIAFFLPRNAMLECVRRIRQSPAKRRDSLFKHVSLGGDTSMDMEFDENFELGQMLKSASYLMTRLDENILRVCSVIVAVDPDAGFTALPVQRVGLVVYSHLEDPMTTTKFNWDAGVPTCSAMPRLVTRRQFRSQRQSCRGIQAKQVCLYKGGLIVKVAHPVNHSKEFVFELIRSWPGKSMSEIPLNFDSRDLPLLERNLDHLAVAAIIEPYENGYRLTGTKGAELVELLPRAVDAGLSFELASLLASVRHCVAHPRSMRLLIRLAVIGGRVDDFLSRLDPVPTEEDRQGVSWVWTVEARQHMAGPARGQMSAGRLWFALGIWDKMRNDTLNFTVNMPRNGDEPDPGEDYCHRIPGVGVFHSGIAVEIYMSVLELEDRVGLRLLAPSDAEWEEPLKVAELQEVQVQLILAFLSNLAVWDVGAGEISLVGSGRAIDLAPSSLIADPRVVKIERRPENAYLLLPDQIQEAESKKLLALSACCMPMSLLRVISRILGEPGVDWLKWP